MKLARPIVGLAACILLAVPLSGNAQVLYSARAGRHYVAPQNTPQNPNQLAEPPTPSPSIGPRSSETGALEGLANEPLLEKPVDGATYRLGPGDVLGLTLQGALTSYEELRVSPEGSVIVPGAGEIPLAGLCLNDARRSITTEVARAFRNERVNVTLLRLRRFTVFVLGQVKQPGQYIGSAAARASEEIRLAGGLLPEASERSIHLTRTDGTRILCDLQRFVRTGDLSANPTVQDGDVILVDFRREGILINGEVHEPGEFEFLEGDSLGNLIGLAGGLTGQASLDTVEVGRYLTGATVPTVIYLTKQSPGLNGNVLSFRLESRDAVLIRTIPHWNIRHTVQVQGEVTYPGVYVVDEDQTTLSELIRRAGGFTGRASLHEASLTRKVDETIKDPEYERLRSVPAADMSPNEYEYFKMRSRQRAGSMAVDFQNVFERGDRSQDVLLKDGDLIQVPPRKAYVTLAGEVVLPGNITYEPGLTVDDYIARAGGVSWKGDPGRTTVLRASTGEWIPQRKAKKIDLGDTIWVPEKTDHAWFSTFKDGLTVATQLATIWLVIRSSTK